MMYLNMKLDDVKNQGDLLELALEDFEIERKDPKVKINMEDDWVYNTNGVCYCCFAGALLRHEFPNFVELQKDKHLTTHDFAWYKIGVYTAQKAAYILNNIRMGYVDIKPFFRDPITFDVPEYSKDPEGFVKKMREILKFLRENKL